VHIIRDGRDVCLSVLIWEKAARTLGRFASWREVPVTMVALWWKTYLRLGREAGGSLDPDLYHEIRYECPGRDGPESQLRTRPPRHAGDRRA
jgi:hypothetical protein